MTWRSPSPAQYARLHDARMRALAARVERMRKGQRGEDTSADVSSAPITNPHPTGAEAEEPEPPATDQADR
jgi:hypothetical protein